MLIDELYKTSVGYLMVDQWDQKDQQVYREPAGTIFFLDVSLGTGHGSIVYAITCRHVVSTAYGHPDVRSVSIRFNDWNGKAQDEPIRQVDWTLGAKTDVAVTRIPDGLTLGARAYSIDSHQPISIVPGRTLFFIGLFQPLPGVERVEAVVRTGSIAAVGVDVPLELDGRGGSSTSIKSHLAECRSWGGESGSPVFAYRDFNRIRLPGQHSRLAQMRDPVLMQSNDLAASEVQPSLIGLLHGHFEIRQQARKGGKVVGEVDANSGIGVIIPINDIIDTLNLPDLVDGRQRALSEMGVRGAQTLRS